LAASDPGRRDIKTEPGYSFSDDGAWPRFGSLGIWTFAGEISAIDFITEAG
jgi:hypothetical protein